MSEMCEPRSSRFILWLLLLLYALKEISWNWFSQRLNESRSQILLNIHKKYCLIKKLMWSDIFCPLIGSWWTFWCALEWQLPSYEICYCSLSLPLSTEKNKDRYWAEREHKTITSQRYIYQRLSSCFLDFGKIIALLDLKW